jgi:sterol 14-demethylase
MLRPVLAKRSEHRGEHADFLQTLVDDPDLAAEGFDVQVGMALCTIFTGYITTAAQICWTLVQLLRHPRYFRTVVAELDASQSASIGRRQAGPPVGAGVPRLEWAIKESVRLRPVMGHYARINAKDYELAGFRMPRGWLTMLCPAVAHRLPEVFTDPERYDPERFSPGRAEDKRHLHALIGFSGGFYRCPGQAFGTAEVKVVLTSLLSRFDLTPLDEEPVADFELGVTRPRAPCVIRYGRRPPAR